MCDSYDVCKLYSEGKLTKLNVALLRLTFVFSSAWMLMVYPSTERHHIYILLGNWCCNVHVLNVKNSILNFIDQFVDFLV